jgi:hypothetical protein
MSRNSRRINNFWDVNVSFFYGALSTARGLFQRHPLPWRANFFERPDSKIVGFPSTRLTSTSQDHRRRRGRQGAGMP